MKYLALTFILILAILTGFLLALFNMRPDSVSAHNAGYISEGMSLLIQHDGTQLTLRHAGPLRRIIEWNGQEFQVDLQRRSARFRGRGGIYSTGNTNSPSYFIVLYQEGTLAVENLEEAVAWTKISPSSNHLITSDGLIFGLYFIPQSNNLGIDILQVIDKNSGHTIKFSDEYSAGALLVIERTWIGN